MTPPVNRPHILEFGTRLAFSNGNRNITPKNESQTHDRNASYFDRNRNHRRRKCLDVGVEAGGAD